MGEVEEVAGRRPVRVPKGFGGSWEMIEDGGGGEAVAFKGGALEATECGEGGLASVAGDEKEGIDGLANGGYLSCPA